jgi:hypothetical protein
VSIKITLDPNFNKETFEARLKETMDEVIRAIAQERAPSSYCYTYTPPIDGRGICECCGQLLPDQEED